MKDSADVLNSEGKLVSDTLLEIVPVDFNDEIHVEVETKYRVIPKDL